MKKTKFGFLVILGMGAILILAVMIFPIKTSVNAEPAAASSMGPEAVVEAFYADYLGFIGEPGTESFRNPLVEGFYRESEYLTVSFREHVDELLSEGIHADPFLCAQDIPGWVATDCVFYAREGATVVVRTSFNQQVFTVETIQADGSWVISSITCGGSPAGQAKAFYTWYLAQLGDRGRGEMFNPLVEGTYLESGMLSEGQLDRLEELLSSGEAIAADPFLLAQDLPQWFSVDPGRTEDTAVVHLHFSGDSIRHLQVGFAREDGRLLIDAIELLD